MRDDQIEEEGQVLRAELVSERGGAGGMHRWRCSAELRARVVAYAGACAADGESHRRIAERLGLCQATVSRWMREARGGRGGFRSVAIVPTERRAVPRAAAAPSSLRLLTPRGFIVEGLEPELLVSLLRMLG